MNELVTFTSSDLTVTAELPDLAWFRERGFRDTAMFDGGLFSRLWDQRDGYVRTHGFSIPCREAVELLKRYAPIVEIGAGTGYWAAIMARAGIDVVATDRNHKNGYRFQIGEHHPTRTVGAAAAVKRWPDRNVFCSWPCYGKDWAFKAASRLALGRCFIYVGEGWGGCTACDRFFRLLNKNFVLVEQQELPQFPGIHDRLEVYRRMS